MELSQMRYFLAVATCQHVTKAAEQLHVAQPALTQSIHRLEKELGVKLLAKKGRGVALTEYGIYLKDKLSPIMESIDRLPAEIEHMAKIESTTIRINVLAASLVMSGIIIGYKKINDGVNFKIVQNSEDDSCDITVSTRLFYQRAAQDDSTRVFTEQIFLAVPKSSKYAKYRKINLSEVAKEDFLALGGSKALGKICDRFCMHAGFTPKVVFESDSPAAVRDLVAAGLGIGFWPQMSWGGIETDSIALIPISNPVCKRDLIITVGQAKSENPEILKFVDYMDSYIKRFIY